MRFLKPYLKKYFSIHSLLSGSSTSSSSNQPKPISRGLKWKVRILQLIFPFALLLFIISLFWDFSDQHSFSLFKNTYSLKGLLRILSVSSLIGYGTNWLAIKMLFYPQTPRPILGQGLIPATKHRLAHILATNLTNTLLNPKLIQKELISQNYFNRISAFLIESTKKLLDDPHFRRELAEEVYKVSSSFLQKQEIREKIITQIKDAILQNPNSKNWILKAYFRIYKHHFEKQVDYFIMQLPYILSNFIRQNDSFYSSFINSIESFKPSLQQEITEWFSLLIEHLPIQTFLEKQLLTYEENRLEKLIWSSTSAQFHYLRDLGGFLGLLGGFILWEPLSLIPFSFLLGLLLLLDWLLTQKKVDKK